MYIIIFTSTLASMVYMQECDGVLSKTIVQLLCSQFFGGLDAVGHICTKFQPGISPLIITGLSRDYVPRGLTKKGFHTKGVSTMPASRSSRDLRVDSGKPPIVLRLFFRGCAIIPRRIGAFVLQAL